MRKLVAIVFLIGSAGVGCDDAGKNDGLPPAKSWQAPPPASGAITGQSPHGGQNPHAGMAMGNPHAGMGMENPHAGLAMENPHAGMAMPPGMQPPDPNRPVDPSKFLKGEIVATDATRKLIKAGDTLFLSARPIEPVSGDVIGAPVAVARIIIDELPAKFELSGKNSMIAGTVFDGAVVIEARIDRDREARTAEPGDIEGKVRATIPAADLRLTLDTILE